MEIADWFNKRGIIFISIVVAILLSWFYSLLFYLVITSSWSGLLFYFLIGAIIILWLFTLYGIVWLAIAFCEFIDFVWTVYGRLYRWRNIISILIKFYEFMENRSL